ncbi:MAG: apolipoprotein N-acyltransferase [Spirochaetaceae bacterium]|jgi:apolipoprotein N-acyltransferase|nr:apolipoprotein N-acyltransferase [Spirochaetaceae bacterium]
MIRPGNNGKALPFLINGGLVISGALLFAASHPNPLVPSGLPVFAWAAFVPMFYLVRRVNFFEASLWGAFYGALSYTLFNFWLTTFHPLAGFLAGSVFLIWFALLFPLFRLAVSLFPRRGYLVQWLLWLGWEYVRTRGFLGYSYGIAGYTQWQALLVIQIAGIFGVWGVSALVVFPSSYLAAWLSDGASFPRFARREWLPLTLYLTALGAALIYGCAAPRDFSARPAFRAALVQNNADPWKGGVIQYQRNLESLKALSRAALTADPAPDLVVWSETAFVPRIYWQMHYRDDPASWSVVRDLLTFLEGEETPFLIGNDDGRKENGKRVDYNAALLFRRGVLSGQYRKLRLVPFTEYFPYRKQFPWFYDFLVNADTHFWEPGDSPVVFEIDVPRLERTARFSTPICFEDTFGYLSRDAVRLGAEVIVNITNDSWSGSLVCQMQHLSMSVFRAVENRRSVVRAATSGQTASIAPDGRVTAEAPPFTETVLSVEVPLEDGLTPYTRFGDIWGRAFALLAALALFTGMVRGILNRDFRGPGAGAKMRAS